MLAAKAAVKTSLAHKGLNVNVSVIELVESKEKSQNALPSSKNETGRYEVS